MQMSWRVIKRIVNFSRFLCTIRMHNCIDHEKEEYTEKTLFVGNREVTLSHRIETKYDDGYETEYDPSSGEEDSD